MNIPNWWPHGADERHPELDARVKALETKVEGMYESMIDWVGRIKALELQQMFLGEREITELRDQKRKIGEEALKEFRKRLGEKPDAKRMIGKAVRKAQGK